MHSTPEPEPHHRLLHYKLKESFASVYLTALSVIQSVALADLALVVLGDYQQFNIVHWLLAMLNFVMLIVIWNAYTMQSAMWDWIPDFRDAIIPFVFGALELFLNHAIVLSLSAWLIALALLVSVGVLANWYAGWRAREEAENTRLLSLMSTTPLLRFEMLYMLGLIVILLLFGVISRVVGLEATDSLQTGGGVLALVIVLLAGVGLGAYVFFNIRGWAQIVAYARTGRMPNMEATRSNEEGSP